MMGKRAYPDAKELFITADAGGSNGYRARAWKIELQKFADDGRLRIRVSHFPPGTSKWNKIEHRLFCHITQNWRGKPLRTFETIVEYDSLRLGDVDVDGKADLCGRTETGVVCAYSTGSWFANYVHVVNTEFNDQLSWSAAAYGATLQLKDVNGDGKADVCARGVQGIHCATAR